jgi:hypothetical protein
MLERACGDPHKLGVVVTANEHDFSLIHRKKSRNIVRTLPNQDSSWLQVELTGGVATVDGYRIKRNDRHAEYKLQGFYQSGGSARWEDINASSDGNSEQNSDPRFFTTKCVSSRPYSIFRFVLLAEPRRNSLSLLHVELFGVWEPQDA